ncbi:MAG: hypothetical protein AAF307_04945 [Pseudomonadota bacterium]
MFRLLRLLFTIGVGFYLGLQYSEMSLATACDAVNGVLTDGVCLVSEVAK